MTLLSPELCEKLLANARRPDGDHVPLAKFVNPLGAGVWLATELHRDQDTLYGLADVGYPELGSFRLSELSGIRLPLGLVIERDPRFQGLFPISIWAEAAAQTGSIRAAERVLLAAARCR